MTGADIVAAARGYIGTPWRHGMASRRGCDCAGLLLAVCSELGIQRPRLAYRELPDLALFDAVLPRYALQVAEPRPGDVLRFRVAGRPQHLAIAAEHPQGGASIIHANRSAGHVCEHRIDAKWLRRLVGAWRLAGVE